MFLQRHTPLWRAEGRPLTSFKCDSIMIHVAEEGSRRVGDMTGAEIDQCVLDVESWFRTHAGSCLRDAHGVKDGDTQALEKAADASLPELCHLTIAVLRRQYSDDTRPQALRSVMSIQDGQLWFYEKQALTCKAMMVEALNMEARAPGWRPGLIPFAKDVDGSFLVTDAHAQGCPVGEWDADDGEGTTLAKTFSLFLERFRNELLSGRCEYVEGIGVVEKMNNASSPRGK